MVCTRPAPELQWLSGARMVRFAQCVVRGAWCGLKGGASGPLAIVCTRPAPELQWPSGVRVRPCVRVSVCPCVRVSVSIYQRRENQA